MSSLVKSEVRISTANEIGVRMDDALEAAKSDIARCDGAGSAAVKIASDIETLCAQAQKDIDEGRMDLEQGKLVLSWLQRSKSVADRHAAASQQARVLSQGRVAGYEQAVAMIAKFKGDEENKVRAVLAAAAAEGVAPDEVGPKPTIKQQYAAEDAAEAAKAETEKAKALQKGGKRAKNAR